MSRAAGSRVIALATWLLALLGVGLMYVGFDAHIAEELRKLTKLALTGGSAEEDDDQLAG